jgi:thiamine kinase-like enzyme
MGTVQPESAKAGPMTGATVKAEVSMATCISGLGEISAEWVEECLRSEFGLAPGAIRRVRIADPQEGPLSSCAVVHIDADGNDGALPSSVFVKITNPTDADTIGRKEVSFYREILPRFADRSAFLRCYFAEYRDDHCVFLFEDLSESHTNTEWPLPQTATQCELAVDRLADLHAAWWESRELEPLIGPFPSRDELLQQAEAAAPLFEDFIAFMGDRLTHDQQALLRFVIERIGVFIDRFVSYDGMTFIHGDNHLWNFLFPKVSTASTKIIDWQFWEYGLGAEDLANMIAMQWSPGRRRQHEDRLLRRYHTKLEQNGVRNYSFETLLDDYRWGIISRLVCHPVFEWRTGIPAVHWYNNLERLMLAYEDRKCSTLLRHHN